MGLFQTVVVSDITADHRRDFFRPGHELILIINGNAQHTAHHRSRNLKGHFLHQVNGRRRVLFQFLSHSSNAAPHQFLDAGIHLRHYLRRKGLVNDTAQTTMLRLVLKRHPGLQNANGSTNGIPLGFLQSPLPEKLDPVGRQAIILKAVRHIVKTGHEPCLMPVVPMNGLLLADAIEITQRIFREFRINEIRLIDIQCIRCHGCSPVLLKIRYGVFSGGRSASSSNC